MQVPDVLTARVGALEQLAIDVEAYLSLSPRDAASPEGLQKRRTIAALAGGLNKNRDITWHRASLAIASYLALSDR